METPPRYLPDHAIAFSDATPGWCPRLKESVRRRVRKSSQKEPPVAADADLLQMKRGLLRGSNRRRKTFLAKTLMPVGIGCKADHRKSLWRIATR